MCLCYRLSEGISSGNVQNVNTRLNSRQCCDCAELISQPGNSSDVKIETYSYVNVSGIPDESRSPTGTRPLEMLGRRGMGEMGSNERVTSIILHLDLSREASIGCSISPLRNR